MADRARDARSIPELPDTETASSASKQSTRGQEEVRRNAGYGGRDDERRARALRGTHSQMSSKGSSDREIESQAAEKDAARSRETARIAASC
ncbi:hypothetical protein A0H81_07238 [Grifola frondosa]|uniref:Uncharacterized protein n=1 Tax=Grifola frondosa TaxID=5627 RepID=A0A1C7M939_GRIFR|nr:hypothetical protein A0H81_07238 [Grifola frondosa]